MERLFLDEDEVRWRSLEGRSSSTVMAGLLLLGLRGEGRDTTGRRSQVLSGAVGCCQGRLIHEARSAVLVSRMIEGVTDSSASRGGEGPPGRGQVQGSVGASNA